MYSERPARLVDFRPTNILRTVHERSILFSSSEIRETIRYPNRTSVSLETKRKMRSCVTRVMTTLDPEVLMDQTP